VNESVGLRPDIILYWCSTLVEEAKEKFSFGNGRSRESRRRARNEEKRERAHVPADFRVSHPLRNSPEKREQSV